VANKDKVNGRLKKNFVYILPILIIIVLLALFLYLYLNGNLKAPILAPPVESHSLGISIYTNLSTLLPEFKTAYSNASSSSLLIDDEYATPPRVYITYWNQPQVFSRIILANNYSELTSTVSSVYINDVPFAKTYNFSKTDYLAYDSEDWALTPIIEQENQANYTQMACNYVHAAGYKFGFTPEIDVPGWGQFAKINWTCIDFLDLQEQFETGSTTGLVKNVTQLITVAKGVNPNLIVFVQLDMAARSKSLLESDILAMSQIPGVNGIMIQDLCGTASCNSTLTSLIQYTKSIQNSTSTSTVSVTTTLPTSTSSTTSSTTSEPTTTSSTTTMSVSTTISSTTTVLITTTISSTTTIHPSTTTSSTTIPSTSTSSTTTSTTSKTTTLKSTTSTTSTSTPTSSTTTINPITTSNSSVSLNGTISSNSSINIDLESTNTTIGITSNSTVQAKFSISNVTNSTQQLPNNDVLLALNINVTTKANAIITTNVTTNYPCNISSSSIGVYEFVNNSWIPIGYTIDPVTCIITYNTSIDPIIAIFVKSPNNQTTTTVPHGGGGGNGGNGGGGGSSRPITTKTQNGYIVSNIAQLNTFNLTFRNESIDLIENYITPTSAGLTINSHSYLLDVGQNITLTSNSGYAIYAKLLNVSYLPIQHTITLYVYSNYTTGNQVNVTSLEINFQISNITTPEILPTYLTNTIFVKNVFNTTPEPPKNYTKIVAIAINTNFSSINQENISITYGCNILPNNVQPFELYNSTWVPINKFYVNQTLCEVFFTVERNQTIGLMQLAPQLVTQSTTTTIITSNTISAASSNTLSQTTIYGSDYLYLVIGIIVIMVLIFLYYYFTHRKN
jgi:hypothetical protein